MKYVVSAIAAVAVLIGLGWVLTANDLAMFGFFSPKYENVRRNVYENTNSYNAGINQELQRIREEYMTAGPEQKVALRSLILHQSANYDLDHLKDPSLAAFIIQLRSGS